MDVESDHGQRSPFTYFREGQLTFLHPQHTFAVTDSCSQFPNLLDPVLLAAAQKACFTGQTDSGAYAPFQNGGFTSNFGVTPGLGPSREGGGSASIRPSISM